MLDFTVEETNLIWIFHVGSRGGTLAWLRDAQRFIDIPELQEIARSSARKLEAMTDTEFDSFTFAPAYPVIYSEDESVVM